MAISIKSNPVANRCPTHITVSRDMSPKSYTYANPTHAHTPGVICSRRGSSMKKFFSDHIYVLSLVDRHQIKSYRKKAKRKKKNKYHTTDDRHDTFNAFKSISSSEQFTEEPSWCAILTYLSLLCSSCFSLFPFLFFFF